MGDPIERFNELADQYDEFTQKMPNHEKMTKTIVELFNQWFESHEPESICELGCGTGSMARTIAEEYTPDRYLALDGAVKMVEKSISHLSDYNGSTHLRFEQQAFETWEPQETFDIVYSSLSIHHMTNDQKRGLYQVIHDTLREGGLFLYADIFEPAQSLDQFYYEIKKSRQMTLGMTEEEFKERWKSHLENDIPSNWQTTIEWLEESGFETVDYAWKNMSRAVLMAIK